MNELHEQILRQARDEVMLGKAKTLTGLKTSRKDIEKEAALLAMEKLSEFYRWASKDHAYYENAGWYQHLNLDDPAPLTDLELYKIYEGREGK